jgi:hypothetical protein
MSIIKASEIDLSKITFSDVKVDNNGRKMVYVNYNGGKLLIQTPKMYVPNGIKRWRKKDAADNKDDSFEMEMSFGGEEKDDKNSVQIRDFHQKLEEFDELVRAHILKFGKDLLGGVIAKKLTADNVDFHYAPSVRVPTDSDGNVLPYPSRVKAKLDRERDGDDFTGRFLSNKRFKEPILMFDESKAPLTLNETTFESVVPKGSQVVAVLELVYLSISTKVSAKWKLVQGKVAKNQQAITGYAMLDDDEVDDLDTETPVETVTEQVAQVTVEDEDEDEDEEVEVEVENEVDELEPEPVVTKPVAKGRKRGVVA